MINLIKKETYTEKELNELDLYFDTHIEEFFDLDNDIIVRFITTCENTLGYSLTNVTFENHVCSIICDEKYNVDEEKLEYYEKLLDLVTRLSYWDVGLFHALGDHYYYKKENDKAISYYDRVFKKGFDLSNIQYFDSLVNYLRLLNINPSEKLKELIINSPNTSNLDINAIDTYLLLIINLEKFSDEYLSYINKATNIAKKVVRKLQETNTNPHYWSDSDEERDLCELVALKFEYYVNKKDYVNAMASYNELTEEIGRSDCTRYYHARDKFYQEMIDDLANTYKELKFFDDLGYKSFKVLENVSSFKENDTITLEKDNGLRYSFKVSRVYDDKDVVLTPTLPIIGEGAHLFLSIVYKDNILYLENRLSH